MEIELLADELWRLHTPIVQSYALAHGRGVVLVDTSIAGHDEAILGLLGEALGIPSEEVVVEQILLTHAHADHIGSAAALAGRTGAPVLGPVAEAEEIAGRVALPPPRLRDWEEPIFAASVANVPPAPPVELDRGLRPGESLDWAGGARVVHAPGHTPGQLAVWLEDRRILVAADAIASHEGNPMPGVFNIDPEQTAATALELAALDPDIACFGHGEPLVVDAGARLRAALGSMTA
jgi:glyoxylase-like metal-dependent hydrolase (beta-lactamase superfamily II)